MKLDKAIEILSQDITYTYPAKFTDLQDAIKLGREALKAILAERTGNVVNYRHPLPGETPTNSPTLSKEQIKKLRESPIGEK